MSSIQQLSAAQVHDLLQAIAEKRVLVVDVREDDHKGGHIPGSINMPAGTFHENVDKLLKQATSADTVIFHCMFSQQRGPRTARMFAEALQAQAKQHQSSSSSDSTATADNDAKSSDSTLKQPTVAVLTGGFKGWLKYARTHSDAQLRKKLIEKYDKKVWGYTL